MSRDQGQQNCCDLYGDCRQGRDCPLRPLPITMHEPDDLDLMPWLGAAFIAVCAVLLCMAAGFFVATFGV